MTVVMKIDLVGPRRRGLALGLNEAAGYGGVALAAGISGWLAAEFAARDVLVVAGAVIAAPAFLLSVLFVRDTAAHVALEQTAHDQVGDGRPPSLRVGVPPRDLPRARRCARARRPAWSTTSTTRSPGGSSRSSSPPTARASPTSASSPRCIRPSGAWRRSGPATGPTVVGRKPLIAAGMLHPGRRARPARPQRRRARHRRGRRRRDSASGPRSSTRR